jgi:sarcosine oxidase subunit beta
VIGAGVIGSSIALNLARRGYNVMVVDGRQGAGQGSTSYSSGVCRMFYSTVDNVKLSWEGYQYWKNWQDYLGEKDERGMASLTET